MYDVVEKKIKVQSAMETRSEFLFKWIVGTVMGWVLGWILAILGALLFYEIARISLLEDMITQSFSTSFIVALIQASLISHKLDTQHKVLRVSVVSAALCTIAQFLLFKYLPEAIHIYFDFEYSSRDDIRLVDGWLPIVALSSTILGISFSLPQWWILRNHRQQTTWWIVDTIVGIFTGLMLIIAVASRFESLPSWSLLCSYCVFSPAVFAFITGLTLHKMLSRKPKPKNDDVSFSPEENL